MTSGSCAGPRSAAKQGVRKKANSWRTCEQVHLAPSRHRSERGPCCAPSGHSGLLTGARLMAASRLSPGLNGRERRGDEARGFRGGDTQKAQLGLSELINGRLVDAFGVALAYPQQ